MPPAFVLSHNQTLKLSKFDISQKFTERPLKRNTSCINKKYLLIRIQLTFVKNKLRIVVYVSLYYLINLLKSIVTPHEEVYFAKRITNLSENYSEKSMCL